MSSILSTLVERAFEIPEFLQNVIIELNCAQYMQIHPLLSVNKKFFDVVAGELYEEDPDTPDGEGWKEKRVWEGLEEKGATADRIKYYQSKVRTPRPIHCPLLALPSILQFPTLSASVETTLAKFPNTVGLLICITESAYGDWSISLERETHTGRWVSISCWDLKPPAGLVLPVGKDLFDVICEKVGTTTEFCPVRNGSVAEQELERGSGVVRMDEMPYWTVISPTGRKYARMTDLNIGGPVDYPTFREALTHMPALQEVRATLCDPSTAKTEKHPDRLDYIGELCPNLRGLFVSFFSGGRRSWGSPKVFPFLETIDTLVRLCPRLERIRFPTDVPFARRGYHQLPFNVQPCAVARDWCSCSTCFDISKPRWPNLTFISLIHHPEAPHSGFSRPCDVMHALMLLFRPRTEAYLQCTHDIAGNAVEGGREWTEEVEDARRMAVFMGEKMVGAVERRFEEARVGGKGNGVGWKQEMKGTTQADSQSDTSAMSLPA